MALEKALQSSLEVKPRVGLLFQLTGLLVYFISVSQINNQVDCCAEEESLGFIVLSWLLRRMTLSVASIRI